MDSNNLFAWEGEREKKTSDILDWNVGIFFEFIFILFLNLNFSHVIFEFFSFLSLGVIHCAPRIRNKGRKRAAASEGIIIIFASLERKEDGSNSKIKWDFELFFNSYEMNLSFALSNLHIFALFKN